MTVRGDRTVRPHWAIYRRLDDFTKPLEAIFLAHFSSEICFTEFWATCMNWAFFIDIWRFFT